MIKITNLSKSFGKKTVLNNLSIEFQRGKICGIIGENGAGKSTLFRCIAGLESFDGEIVSQLSPLKDHLGYLTAEPFFFSMITGEEYIRLLCNARNKKLPELDKNNIFDLPLNQYISTYSTGMRKKIALLAVLLQGNDILILDEPIKPCDNCIGKQKATTSSSSTNPSTASTSTAASFSPKYSTVSKS